jgi:lanosterol synthase
MSTTQYDVAIIGGGPVGCVTALAFAREHKRVLLLEANPKASQRLAGEWLHPPAVEVLKSLVGDLPAAMPQHKSGAGFVVFTDDGNEPVTLPYQQGSHAISVEHHVLVGALRQRCEADQLIDYRPLTRALKIDGQRLTFQQRGGSSETLSVDQIVGAGGRQSIAHTALGVEPTSATYSRMAGVLLEDCELPNEGYGHVFLGGPGPVLAYRLDDRVIRLCLDVPLSMPVKRSREAVLWEAFRPVLPEQMHEAFMNALHQGVTSWAANQSRPRSYFGREGLTLVGDSVGHHHPLTALGMTVGFQDGVALARCKSFASFKKERIRASRVPEMLAVALYEIFADTSDELVTIRRAVYELWRRSPAERERTMRFLAAQDTAPHRFGSSFVHAIGFATRELFSDAIATGRWRHNGKLTLDLVDRCRWLISGALRISEPKPSEGFTASLYEQQYGGALKASSAKAEVVEHPAAAAQAAERASAPVLPHIALERAIRALKAQQDEQGAWEGECIWCPMLPAQYIIMCHLTGTPITPQRRRRLLLQFERTQLPDGSWSLSEGAQPYLFLTTLVYVAARLLGANADDPLLTRAAAFISDQGGAVSIPSWGKFWLALLGLYDWDGVNPVLPEVWQLPRWVPLHPSNYYCHTRLIYLGLASLYGEQIEPRDPALIASLRRELFPEGFDQVDWNRARHQLRKEEIITPPHPLLKLAYDGLRQLNKRVSADKRAEHRAELREQIRFEFKSSDYTCISPVSGLLNILALWRHDPNDEDFQRAIARFDGWLWEDDVDGTRVTGARSASWDTAFAVQALTAASPHFDVTASLERADAFLQTQQIQEPQMDVDYREYARIDPRGGYCFAGVWHGWPVSDCTAEALCARLDTPTARATDEELRAAASFILRTQNSDGGFGSYEPYKSDLPLEWLNPAEMFGDSMTEHSYIECTTSCIAALATFRERFPQEMRGDIDRAVERAAKRLRVQQHPDGTWDASWGIHFTYSIMFGIRGMMAAGAPTQDPSIRKACRWLKRHQRADGGWGEACMSSIVGEYIEADESQVIQTAWALTGLLEAQDPDWDVIERAAHFLAKQQHEDGSFPKQQPAGIFFHTALLHYEMYRYIFPLWALGLYETRRHARMALASVQPLRKAETQPRPQPA